MAGGKEAIDAKLAGSGSEASKVHAPKSRKEALAVTDNLFEVIRAYVSAPLRARPPEAHTVQTG